MVTMTDQQFIQMKFEASEYRRLLTICREQVTYETERADKAGRTVESLLTMLRRMVEAFSPDIYRMAAAQFGKDQAADLAHQQACDLIKRIEGEMKQGPSLA
jgi:hypothetical protein